MAIFRKYGFIFLLLIASGTLFISCEPLATEFDDIETASYYQAASLKSVPDTFSAIRVMTGTDGLDWQVAGEPVLAPTGHGWAASHVYALDVRDTPDGIRLYANGRTAAHWTRGRERIGLARPRPA